MGCMSPCKIRGSLFWDSYIPKIHFNILLLTINENNEFALMYTKTKVKSGNQNYCYPKGQSAMISLETKTSSK